MRTESRSFPAPPPSSHPSARSVADSIRWFSSDDTLACPRAEASRSRQRRAVRQTAVSLNGQAGGLGTACPSRSQRDLSALFEHATDPDDSGWPRSRRRISMIEPPSSNGGRGEERRLYDEQGRRDRRPSRGSHCVSTWRVIAVTYWIGRQMQHCHACSRRVLAAGGNPAALRSRCERQRRVDPCLDEGQLHRGEGAGFAHGVTRRRTRSCPTRCGRPSTAPHLGPRGHSSSWSAVAGAYCGRPVGR